MKKDLISIPVFVACVFLMALAITGCGTNAPTQAAQADQIVITSVNAGMSLWVNYVNAGKATQSQIDKVRMAYNAYYTAQQVAKAVIEKAIVANSTVTAADIATANQAVNDAETALLTILNQFLNGK